MTARGALGALLAAIVVASVAGGLVVSGSPAEARLGRLDGKRVEDLTWLSHGIRTFRTRESALPATLSDLAAAGIMGAERADPERGTAYEYRVIDDTRYELCAEFSTDSSSTLAGNVFWAHRVGRECFVLDASKPRGR